MRLLFCDTFSQEPPDGSVNSSWSAIDFPSPVVLEEIHVVPRGIRLHDQLTADGQCGKTAPGHFRIDFFACDAKNEPDAVAGSTFENLCALEYNETSCTIAYPRLPFVTTKILCSGWYASVTLAVFGAEASDSNAIRLIHERRTNTEKRSMVQTHFGAPQNLYPPDDGRSGRFPSQHLPPIHQPVSASSSNTYHGFVHDKDAASGGYAPTEQSNYQPENFDSRGYHDRQNDNYQYRSNRPRDSSYNKTPLLPTPSAGHGGQVSNQRTPEKYHYGNLPHGQSDSSFPNQNLKWDNDSYSSYREDESDFSTAADEKKVAEGNGSRAEQGDSDWEDAEYEEISDEELDEETAANMEAMVAEDMLLPSTMMAFNPFHMELYPISHFRLPEVTVFEMIRSKLLSQDDGVDENREKKKFADDEKKNGRKLEKIISDTLKLCQLKHEDKVVESSHSLFAAISGKESEWVTYLEKLIPLIQTGLPYLEYNTDADFLVHLRSWSVSALQLESPVANLIGVNVRALKAGLNLAQKLCNTASDIAEQLRNVALSESLLKILSTKHIASSLKIKAVHVLDSMTNWPLLIHEFTFGEEESEDKLSKQEKPSSRKTKYTRLVELALQPQATRVAAALSQLLRKIHVYECMHEIQIVTHSIVTEKIPDEYDFVSDEENSDDDHYSSDEEEEMVVVSSVAPTDEVEMEGETDPSINSSLLDQPNIEISICQDKGKRKVVASETSIQCSHEVNSDEQAFQDNNESVVVPLESVLSFSDISVTDKDLEKISECLKEITEAFRNPQDTIGQFSIQTFPLSKRSTSSAAEDDLQTACATLYRMSEGTGLLSSLQVLLTMPVVSGHKALFASSFQFLEHLMGTKSGLLHLLSNSDSLLHVIHHLIKSSPHLDVETPGTGGYLGTKLAFSIQAMQSIDHICGLLESEADEEDIEEELVHAFKMLFSLAYPAFGKEFVCQILSTDDLLKPLLACLCYPRKLTDPDPVVELKKDEKKSSSDNEKSEDKEEKNEEKEEAVQQCSAVNSYAALLLHLLFENSDNVAYLFSHTSDIRRACLSTGHVAAKSEGFKKILSPLEKKLAGDNSDIKKLVFFIKDETELLEWSSLTIDGPGICTALRLLCHLCIKGSVENHKIESRLGVLELFSADALNVLLSLAQKIHKSLNFFCRGIHAMTSGISSSSLTLVTSICKSIFSLIHLMLLQVLDARIVGESVNDVHITQVTESLYSDLHILLRPSDTSLLHKITEKAVAVLAVFFSHSPSSDKPLPVIGELIKYAEAQCDNFVPTLLLLSQLLPIPLPIVTPEMPPDNARITVLSSCKLWSGYMAPHVDNLVSFLLPLSSSTSRPVIEVVVILVQQIIDLSPSLALTVVKKYLEDISPLLVSTSIANEDEDVDVNADASGGEKELMLSPEQITSILTFSEILTLPAAKTAAISVLHTNGEGIMDLWTYASNPHTPKEDLAAVLLFVSVLVDTNVALLPVDKLKQSLANAFLPSHHLTAIIDFAVDRLDHPSACVSSRAFLALALLLKTRFSFPFVCNRLFKSEMKLLDGIKVVCEQFDSALPYSVDSLLNAVALVFSLIETTEQLKEDDKEPISMTKAQVKTLLHWGTDTLQHPFYRLKVQLEKLYSDDGCSSDGIGAVLDRLTSLCQSFDVIEGATKLPSYNEKELPDPTPLLEQFAERLVFVIGDNDTCLRTQLSVTAPPAVYTQYLESERPRVVQCDLIATAEEFCPGYNLAEELGKLAKAIDVERIAEESEVMEKRRQKMKTFSARLGKSLTFMKRSHGLLMTQHATNGRGRGRGRGNPSNRPYDLFRHRKQNTSRPPSMHVDDFVAADEEQQHHHMEAEPMFKSPPPLMQQVRRAPTQSFKPRDFIPRGGRGGRGSRNNGYRGRGGGFSSGQSTGNSSTQLNKFRPRTSNMGSRGGRPQERFRGVSSRMNSRLSYSPYEGFKTNKQDQGPWSGHSRNYSSGSPNYRGRGSKFAKTSRSIYPFSSPGRGKSWGASSFQRRGGLYNKSRGKHIRSSTR